MGEANAKSYLLTARNQWAFIPTTENTTKRNIYIYDGSKEELLKYEPDLNNYACVTFLEDITFVGHNYYIGGGNRIRKFVYQFNLSRIYIPKQPLLSLWNDTNYKGAYVHELGHALGWYDHCTFSTAIMYSRSKVPSFSLTFEDRIHLYQIYDPNPNPPGSTWPFPMCFPNQ